MKHTVSAYPTELELTMSSDMLSVEEISGTMADLLKKLGGPSGRNIHNDLKLFLRGENPRVAPVIDLDAAPFIPDGWKIEEHVKGGQFEWNPEKVRFHLDEGQLNGEQIEGNKLRKKLADLKPFNANLLDFLIAHQHLIPESWKKDAAGNDRFTYFWGTVYRRSDGHLCVRYLGWSVGQWYWSNNFLDYQWGGQDSAVVPAS